MSVATVAIYARCSTEEQRDSPDVQLAACRDHAAKHGCRVVAEYVDAGVSGGLPLDQRPEAARMLQDARAGDFEAVLALRLDRLGRDQLDLLLFRREAEKRKLKLLFVTQEFADDPTGEFVYSLLGAVSQLERRQTGQRIYEHSLWLAKQGRKPCGAAPLGLAYSPQTKRITANDRADDAVAVFQTYIDSGGSPTRTAAILNAAGIRTSRGNLWSDRGVRLTIRNTLYRQVVQYGGMEFPAPDVPIVVPPELVEQAQALMTTVKGSRPRASVASAYTSILICGLCGQRIVGSRAPATKYRTVPTRRYRCPHTTLGRGCVCRTFGESRLDRCVVPILVDLLKAHADELSRDEARAKPRPRVKTDDARDRLIDLHISGMISKAELQVRLDKLREPRMPMAPPITISGAEIREYLDVLEEKWPTWPTEEKRALLLAIAPRIEVKWVGDDFSLTLYSPLSDAPIMREIRTERSRWSSRNN